MLTSFPNAACQTAQLDETERSSFDHLLHALRCGAPPHGGIALGTFYIVVPTTLFPFRCPPKRLTAPTAYPVALFPRLRYVNLAPRECDMLNMSFLVCGAGFDRLMAILCKAESIRDVIAFPKTGAGTDLLFKSPAPSTEQTLKLYNLEAKSL